MAQEQGRAPDRRVRNTAKSRTGTQAGRQPGEEREEHETGEWFEMRTRGTQKTIWQITKAKHTA